MSTTAQALPAFDKLWNYGKPADTEAQLRALLPQFKAHPEEYLQLMTQIARAQGLQRKFDEAHQTLDEVQAALPGQKTKAEVRYFLERGRVFNSTKKAAEALPLFIKAHELAVIGGFDNLAVDAAHMVAIAESTPEKQHEWNLMALALAEKSEDPEARNWLGSLYNNIGWTYHGSGKFNEAMDMFQKALAFREVKGDKPTIRIAKWCVARTHRSLQRYTEAIEMQKKLESEFQTAAEKDGYVFEELAELYLLTSQNELAKKYFALAYAELSQDKWLAANEAPRLARLKELGGI